MTCTATPTTFSLVAPKWKALLQSGGQHAVFLTPEWQQTWWDQFGAQGQELRLLVIGDEAQPLGFAPMVRNGDTLAFLGGTDLFDYHDFIHGGTGQETFYTSLTKCLQEEPWRIMDLRSLREDSPTLRYLPKFYEDLGYEVSVVEEDVAPGAVLPATWDEYLSAMRGKDRHELRRKFRRLEQAGPYRLVCATKATLTQDIELFLELMQESREEKRSFMTTEREVFFRRIVTTMQDAGYLRLFFLELADERVASVICFDYAGRRFLYNSGYRLPYATHSVGLMLKALCLRDAIESGLTYFDFLRGAEPYKYHLGGHDVRLFRLIVRR